MSPAISVVLITRNEEKNLDRALRSVATWANEIVVVDMMSEDRTVEIARHYGARVFSHERIPAFDGARGFAVSQAVNEWVLLLDADELIPEPLSRYLHTLAGENSADVFRIPRRTYFQGVPISHTGWGPSQDKQLRLFKKGFIVLDANLHCFIKPAPHARVKTLDDSEGRAIEHFSYIDCSHFLTKLEQYTTVEAQQAFERGKRSGIGKAIVYSCFDFFHRYIRKQGYKDGWRGFYLSGFYAFYRFSVFAKLQEMASCGDREKILASYEETADQILALYSRGSIGERDRNQ